MRRWGLASALLCALTIIGVSAAFSSLADATTPYVPTISQSLSATSIPLGQSITDMVTVHGSDEYGSPTGDVTDLMCGPQSSATGCSDALAPNFGGTALSPGPDDSASVTLVRTPQTVLPTKTGDWCIEAAYGGDDNNDGALDDGPDGCFVVTPAITSTSGTPSAAMISLGSSVTDQATVSGTSIAGDPTGDVSFYACGPLSAASGCDSSADQVASAMGLVGSSTTVARAQAVSAAFTPTQAGIYCFETAYAGDVNNAASTGTGGNCFTAAPAITSTPPTSTPPTTTPQAVTTSTSAPLSTANPVMAAQPLKLTATVTPATSSTPITGGDVVFVLGASTPVCLAPVIDGSATCTTTQLPPGRDSIRAGFTGTTGFTASLSPTALRERVLASNALILKELTARQNRHQLTARLKLPSAGKVSITVVAGARTLGRLTRNEPARTSEPSLTLRLSPAGGIRALRAKLVLTVSITFTPTGGTPRTLHRTMTLAPNRK